MNFRYQPTSDSVLEDILAHNPQAKLHEIRGAHPAFRRVSLDHIGVRLARVLDRRRAEAA